MKKQLYQLLPFLFLLFAGGWLFPASASAQGTEVDTLSAQVVARGYLTALKVGGLDQALLSRVYLNDSAAASAIAADLVKTPPQGYTLLDDVTGGNKDEMQFTAILQPDNKKLFITVSYGDGRWRISKLAWAAAATENATVAASAVAGTATVTAGELNVRSGPGVGYAVTTTLKKSQTMTVVGTNAAKSWYQVAQNGTVIGWVSAGPAYVSAAITGDLPVTASASAEAAPAATAPAETAIPGTLIIQPESGGAFYKVSADGASLTYLSSGIDPALSPDGTKVAFTRWTSGNAGSVWVYDLTTGTERAVLGETQQVKSPTWSADGTKLIVSFQHGGRPEIIEKCNGMNQEIPRGAYDIDFNPDSRSVCYKLPPDPHWQLRRIDVATGAFEDLASATYSMAPTWDTANAWRVVFANNSDGLLQLDLNQNKYTAFTQDSDDRSPVFSPDGSKIAVSYHQDNHWEVHTLDVASGARTQLTSTPPTATIAQILEGKSPESWNNAAPAWSPDGSRIVFITDRTGQWEFWVMNADGSNPQTLLSTELAAQLKINYNGMDERLITWR